MIKVSHTVIIERPLEQVFDYVSDPTKLLEWQPGLIRVEHSGTRAEGTLKETYKWFGRRVEHVMEIVDHEPNARLRYKSQAEHSDFERHWTFEATPEGTRVSLAVTVDTRGALGLAKGTFEKMVQRDLRTNLEHLKDLLEIHEDFHAAHSVLPKHDHR